MADDAPQPHYLTLTELLISGVIYLGGGYWIAGSAGWCAGLALLAILYGVAIARAASATRESRPRYPTTLA